MAWEWLNDKDEPQFPEVTVKDDGKRRANPEIAKLHNGLIEAENLITGALGGIPAAIAGIASTTAPSVSGDIEREMEGYDMDPSLQQGVQSALDQAQSTTAPIWSGVESGIRNARKAITPDDWEPSEEVGPIRGAADTLLEAAPQMAAQAAIGIIGGPATAGALMGAGIGGDQYFDLRDKGVDPQTAAAAGVSNALIQSYFEKTGMEPWLNARTILKNHGLLKAIGTPFLSEGATEAIQEVPDELTSYYAEHGTLDGFDWKQLGLNAAEAGLVGGFYGSLFGGINLAAGRLANKDDGEQTSEESTPDINNPQFAIADDADYADMADSTKMAANLAINKWNSLHPDMPMTMTSGKRNGDGSSHHDSGNAFDVVCDAFEGEDGRKYRDEYKKILEDLGLRALDEYNGSGNEQYAHGENFHATVPDGWNGGNTNVGGGGSTDDFLAAIAQQESGGEDDPCNAVNGDSGAYGKYQITPGTWADWAPRVGLPANAEMTPENQEKVAHAMADYYRKEFGDVGAAIAWYGGEGKARRYVNGEMSQEELNALEGQYPSIASYAASIVNRMGGRGDSAPVSSARMEEPKSAEDFLKDMRDSTDITTDEGRAREQELDQVINSSKEAQEAYAEKLGWKKNAQEAPVQAPQSERRVNTQTAQANAVQTPPTTPIANVQAPQTQQIETPKANAPKRGKRAKAMEKAKRFSSGTPRPVQPTASQQATPAQAPVQANEKAQLPTPASPLPPAQEQAQQVQEQPKEPRKPSNARIQKALNDKPFNDLVKRAYVDGDQSAMEQVQKANPYLVEAVRNKVVGGNTNETTKTPKNPEVRELLPSNQENQPVNTQSELPEAEESEIPEGAEEKQPVNNPQTNTTDSGIKAGDRIEVDGKRYTVNGVFNGGKGKSIQATGDDGITFTFVGDKAKSAKKVAWNNATPEEIEEAPAEEAPKAEPSKAEKPAEKPAEEQAEKPAPKKQAPAKKATPKKAEPKPAKVEEKAEEKPAKTGKPAEEEEQDSPWGSTSEEAIDDTFSKMSAALSEELGIPKEEAQKPPKKENDMPADDETVGTVADVDSSDEALAEAVKDLKAALKSSFNRLNSTPLDIVFDPKIWMPAFRVGEILIKRGVKRFADFQKELIAKVGDEIKPWIKSIWEAAKVYPNGVKLSNDTLGLVIRGAGQIYSGAKARGKILTQEEMEAEFKKRLPEAVYNQSKQFIPVAYKAVSNFKTGKDRREEARKLKTATVRTDDGKEFGVTYKIVPADSLVTSNTWDGGVNEKYPSELQPRDRTRKTMNEQVDNMARHLNPKDLAEARSVNEGAPLVNADNVVENGNGRTMAISRAYHHGGDAYNASAKAYKDSLAQNAEKYGYTADEVRNMKNPVLVRQRSKGSDSLQKSIINSTAGGMNMGAGQQAKVDAQKLTNDILRKYNYDGSGDLALAQNRPFVVSALNAITGPNDRDVVFDRNGEPTKAGIQRVKSALTALAYGDNTLLDRMSESTDESNKNIVNAFMAAAPQVAIIRNRVNSGDIPKSYDLPSALSRVVSLYFGTKEEGKSVKTAINEVTLDGKTALNSEGEEHFALFVDENTRKPKKISSAIVDMVKRVETANDKSGDLFKGVKRATLSEIMDKPYRDAHRTEDDLFSAPQEKEVEEKKPETEKTGKKKTGIAFIDDPDSLINKDALKDPKAVKVVKDVLEGKLRSTGPYDESKVITLSKHGVKNDKGESENHGAANIVQSADQIVNLYNSKIMSKDAARKELQGYYDAFENGGGELDKYPGVRKFATAVIGSAVKEVESNPPGKARYLVMGPNFTGGQPTIGSQIVLVRKLLGKARQMMELPLLSNKEVSITMANEPGLMEQAEKEFPRAWKVEDIGNGLLKVTSPADHIGDGNYAEEIERKAKEDYERQREEEKKWAKGNAQNAFHGFLKGEDPMAAGRIRKILEQTNEHGGGFVRRAQFIEDAAENHPDWTLEEFKGKPILDHHSPDGIITPITKTEADYFTYLRENGTMKPVESNVTTEGGTTDGGRSESTGRTDAVRGRSEGGEAGEAGRETAGGNRAGESTGGGREHGQRAGSNEQKVAGGVQERPRKAERGTGVESPDSDGTEGGRTPELVDEPISPKVDKIEKRVSKGEMKDATDKPGHDYHEDSEDSTETRTPATRRNDNIAAIKLLKKLEAENRKATPDEQAILAKYSGWGGLTAVFNPGMNGFAKSVYDDLKATMTKEEWNAASDEANSAFYTPNYVVKAMWDIARRLGFKGGRVLDPACATGKFFSLMPADMAAHSTALQGIEKSSIPARIAAQLYQGKKYNIANTEYQQFDQPNKRGIVAKDNFYDLAITNVPFSSKLTIGSDKTVRGRYQLHNFYFAKTVNKVRPGGLIIFMTSNATMDNAGDAEQLRRELSQSTELVGAFRLPTDLFKGSNAKVTTDIIVLRKLNEGEAPKPQSWEDASPQGGKGRWGGTESNLVELLPDSYAYGNRYFVDHPDNVIGKFVVPTNGRYDHTVEVVTKDDNETNKLLNKAIETLPQGIYEPRAGLAAERRTVETADAEEGQQVGDIIQNKDGTYSHVAIDSKTGNLKQVPYSASNTATVRDWLALDKALGQVLDMQVDPKASEEEVEAARKQLNTVYDKFVKAHGYVNAQKNMRLFGENIGAYRIFSIENFKAGPKGGTAEKTEIFTERTAYPPGHTTLKITNVGDALIASQLKFGHVDIDYMAQELHKPADDVVKELGNSIFFDPDKGTYVTRDEYLSGNVREKLVSAENMAQLDSAYQRNVDELKAVIPKDLKITANPADGISLSLGMSPDIVPVEDVQAFTDALLGAKGAVKVSYNNTLGRWRVQKGKNWGSASAQVKYGKYGIEGIGKSSSIGADEVIEACMKNDDLMNRSLFKPGEDDTRATLEKREQAKVKARDAKSAIEQAFVNYVISHPDLKKKVENNYNNRFNANVLRKWDGSFLQKYGLQWVNKAKGIKLRSHQLNAVWRILNQRATLLAHCVGSGKTWTMQAAGMELKRLGLAHKILYITPSNVVSQFAREFYQINPSAKILVIDKLPPNHESIEFDIHPIRVLANGVEIEAKKDAERSMGRPKLDANGNPVVKKIRVSDEKAKKRRIDIAKRNAILHKIKVNDWDAIIMSHDTFKAIPMSDDYMINFLNSELDKARAALNEQKLIDEEEGKKGRNSRNIETTIDKIKDKLAELMNHKTYDMGLDTFETLGIDQLFVDEADIYRKLETPTQMSRISGISTDGNEKTTDFYAKMLWLMNPNNAHGAVFATGTPISNSVVELYTMFRYLGQEQLDDMGIRSFDQFAKPFLNINQGLAQSSSGQGVEYKNMVLGLNNAPECINAYRQFADVQTIQDLPEIARKLPKAHYKNEVIPKSPWWTKFQKDIAAWFDAVKHTPFKERKGNMSFFATNNTSRDAVYSPYMVDKNAPAEEAFARAWKCADNVYDEYVKSNDRKGTQLIFCDRAVPGPGKTFDIYNVIKKRLIEDGIPEKEIAFIEQKTTDAERAKIFQAVNKGEIRVLIGSTAKMGAGTNMQTHLVALHHYDCPWMPRDIEQREGRILRQGNENSDVTIYSYINQGSYDGRLWDIIRAKTTAFGMVLHGDPTLRTYEVRDVDANDPIAKIELAQDNPKKRRLAQAANELREAQVKKITYDNAQRQAKAIIATYPQQISISEDLVKKVAADIDMRGKPTGAKFSIKIGNTVYDNQNKANEAMAAQKEQIAKDFVQVIKIGGPDARLKDVKVGTCKGFDIYVSGDSTAFRGTHSPESLELLIKGKDVYKTGGTNTARGVWNAIFREPDAKLDKLKKQIESDKMELEEAQKVVKETFGGDAQIEKLKKEIDQLNREIAGNSAGGQMEDAMRGGDAPVNVEAMFSEDDPVGGVEAALRESRDRKDPDNERALDDSVPLSVSFDKPSNWDEDYKDIYERTGWNIADKGGKITIETTSGEMENLSQIYSGEVEDFRNPENYEITDKADNTIHYDRKALEAEVMDNFPNAQNVQTSDSGMEFDLPNGSHMTVNFTNEAITVDRAQASKAYGREIGENETARGSMRITTDRNGIMTLTVDTVEETPSHEAMHFAMQFLTPRERAALNKMYKNEEAICEGMRVWKIARKNHKGTLLGKIFQRISDLAYKVLGLFHETDKNVFRKVAEGQMWERKSDNASAAKVSYLMGIGNAADDFLKKHSKYLVKPGETKEVEKGISIKGRKADTGWGGITSVLRNSVISPSRIKDPIVSRLHAMGDRATRVQQELYAKWGTDYSTNVLKHLDTDDKKKAFDDLMFAEDSLKHEFTDAELREEKVDEDVIKAHDNARRILKDVYKHVNDVYTSARPITHSYNTRKEAEAALKDAEKQPYTEVLGKITEIHMPSGRVRYQLTIKQPKSYKTTAQPMSRRELAALKRDKYNHVDHITYMSDGSLQVSYTTYAKPLTNMEGYMPHLFHDFFVIARAKDGSTEVVGSATTQKGAIEAARKYRAEHPEMEMLVAPKQFASEGDVQNPILLGDNDYRKLMHNLTWGSMMTVEEAEELSNAAMKGRHVFFSALKKRKGVQGFEHNARWAIQQHIASSARYCALDPFKSYSINLFERAYGDYYKDYGTLSKEGFAKGYIDSVLGKPGTLENAVNRILRNFPPFRNMPRPAKKLAGTLTGTVGLLKLGASPAAAFVNVLQILNANLYVSPHQVAAGMKHAMKRKLDEADLAVLKACGTDEEVGLSVEGGMDKVRLDETSLTKAGERYRRLSELAMKPFTKAESLIRRATTLAAYYDYMDKHKNMKDKTLLRNQAIAHAREVNRKVNFDYSVADAPRLFRALEGTVVGDVALQFQKYGVKQLEVISDLFNPNISAKNKVAFIVPYLLIGGLWNAAPFEDLLLSLIGLITGTDDPEDKAKKAMMEWAGNDPAAKALVNLANYGVGSVVGMDISQRAGLKGVTPNTNPLTGGAFGSTVAGLGKAILNADAGGAIKSLSPEVGNIYQAASGHGTDSKGRKTVDYDGYDRVMKVLGFRTIRDATAADYQNIVYNYKETKRNDRSKARQAYLEDPSSKNYSKLRELGYTAKQIDALKKEQGNDNRLTRAEKGLSKKDLKDLQGLRDYVQ